MVAHQREIDGAYPALGGSPRRPCHLHRTERCGAVAGDGTPGAQGIAQQAGCLDAWMAFLFGRDATQGLEGHLVERDLERTNRHATDFLAAGRASG